MNNRQRRWFIRWAMTVGDVYLRGGSQSFIEMLGVVASGAEGGEGEWPGCGVGLARERSGKTEIPRS